MTFGAARLTAPSLPLGVLLTVGVALGPLSTDLYLPSLPALVDTFDSDPARVQLTLSVFLAGFAVAQLAYGALSDRFGRRPVMLCGLALYFLASFACVFAASIEQLIVARFVQALGACAGPVLGRAVVRDAWGPEDSARALAFIGGAMAVAPLVGPILGGVLTEAFGWRASFVLLLLLSGLQWLAFWRWLGETNVDPDANATRIGRMLANFRELLADRNYVACLLALGLSYSALFAFISGSSFILIDYYGLSPLTFGLCFSVVVVGYVAGTQLAAWQVRRVGPHRLLVLGGWLGAAAGAVLLGLDLAGIRSVGAVLAPMSIVAASVGLVMPNSTARALAAYPRKAGAASALMGFAQMSLAALAGIAVGHGVQADPTAMAATVAVCGLAVPCAYVGLARVPAFRKGGT